MLSKAGPASGRLARHCLVILAALAMIAACGDGAVEAVSQEDYLTSARAFESERAEHTEEVVACAADQGVEADTTWDHGLVLPPGLDRDEADAYWDVVGGCAEDIYPAERDPSEAELEEQYGLLLAAKECLESEGYETTEPTDLEEFLDAYASDGPPLPWSPYELVAQREETFRAAVEVCPQPGRY